jgi:hypothetical protein
MGTERDDDDNRIGTSLESFASSNVMIMLGGDF